MSLNRTRAHIRVLTIGLVLFAGSTSWAQGGRAQIWSSYQGSQGSGSCVDAITPWSAAAYLANTCTPQGNLLSTSASATAGRLTTRTTFDMTSNDGQIFGGAYSYWSDQLNFSAQAAATRLQFSVLLSGVRVAGFNQVSSGGFEQANSSATFSLTGSVVNSQLPNPGLQSMGRIVGTNLVPDYVFGDPYNTADVLFLSYMYDVQAGLTSAGIAMSLASSSSLAVYGDPLGSALSSTSYDARIVELSFRDALGNDITDQMNYQFQNGTEVYESSVTPEPGTLVLLVTGLIVVSAASRRRRAA